jgi:hypothetical protein
MCLYLCVYVDHIGAPLLCLFKIPWPCSSQWALVEKVSPLFVRTRWRVRLWVQDPLNLFGMNTLVLFSTSTAKFDIAHQLVAACIY